MCINWLFLQIPWPFEVCKCLRHLEKLLNHPNMAESPLHQHVKFRCVYCWVCQISWFWESLSAITSLWLGRVWMWKIISLLHVSSMVSDIGLVCWFLCRWVTVFCMAGPSNRRTSGKFDWWFCSSEHHITVHVFNLHGTCWCTASPVPFCEWGFLQS